MNKDKFHKHKIFIKDLKNSNKYIGKNEYIISRSSWEFEFIKFCDREERVLEWANEEVPIKYISPLDRRQHTYFPDFYVKILNKKNITEYIIEIKPYKETMNVPDLSGNKRKSTKIEEVKRFVINRAKWKAAKDLCQKMGIKFKLITEKELGL